MRDIICLNTDSELSGDLFHMKNFWSYIENGKYGVGCTGQTVYLYDKKGTELAKFKDLPYAYKSAFSPLGNIFIVKTTEGRLAVYSLETLSLIKKFRYSKVNGAQDDGFCFSPDGKCFINVERQGDSVHSAISIYDTSDFTKISQLLLGDKMTAAHVEFADGEYYVLGFMRGDDGVLSDRYIGKFVNNEIREIQIISEREYEFYNDCLDLKLMGFTEKAYEGRGFEITLAKLRSADHSLAKLWIYYTTKTK